MFASEHYFCVGTGAGFHEEVFGGAVVEFCGYFGGGGAGHAAAAGGGLT